MFENDRLIPVNLNLSTRNYDILTFAKPSTTTALNGHRVNRTCSQIVALRGRSVERVDLTIEIDLPRAYSRLLKLIYTQLANVSAANSERSSVDRNLFEYIFQSDRADFLRDESDVDEDDLPVMIISNGEWSTIAGSIEVGFYLIVFLIVLYNILVFKTKNSKSSIDILYILITDISKTGRFEWSRTRSSRRATRRTIGEKRASNGSIQRRVSQ